MIEQTKRALAAIDITSAVETAQRENGEMEQLHASIATGEKRAAELMAAIRDLELNGPDGDIAAAAMLRGEIDITGEQTLRNKLAGIQAGLKTLRRRRSDMETDRRIRSSPLEGDINEALAPLLEQMRSAAVEAIVNLAQIYADADALSIAAPRSWAPALRDDLVEFLIDTRENRLGRNRSYAVSEDLLSLADTPCMEHLKRVIIREARPPFRVSYS